MEGKISNLFDLAQAGKCDECVAAISELSMDEVNMIFSGGYSLLMKTSEFVLSLGPEMSENNKQIFTALLQQGANPDVVVAIPDSSSSYSEDNTNSVCDKSVLSIACMSGSADMVNLLLPFVSSKSVPNVLLYLSDHLPEDSEVKEATIALLCAQLLSHDPAWLFCNQTTLNGEDSCFHIAARNGRWQLLQVFIEYSNKKLKEPSSPPRIDATSNAVREATVADTTNESTDVADSRCEHSDVEDDGSIFSDGIAAPPLEMVDGLGYTPLQLAERFYVKNLYKLNKTKYVL